MAKEPGWADRMRADRDAAEAKLRAGRLDPPREGETFEQFHARHIQAQTLAAKDAARDLATIKSIAVLFTVLFAVGCIVLLITSGQVGSRY